MKRFFLIFLFLALISWVSLPEAVLGQAPAEKLEREKGVENSSALRESAHDADDEASPPSTTRRVRRSKGEIVQVGQDYHLGKDEEARSVVVIGGNVVIDGTTRELVVVSGSAKVNGVVEGQTVVTLGSLTLGPEAVIENDIVLVGGQYNADPQAVVEGEPIIISMPDWSQGWLKKGFFYARPFPPQFSWTWLAAAAVMAVYLVVALVFPRPASACVNALGSQPIGSFFTGFLTLLLLGPVLFLLAVSVAGILVIPFVFCGFIVACLFGKVAVYAYTGKQILRQPDTATTSRLPLLVLLGGILFMLLYMVPVVGFIVWGMVSLMGLGAAILAMFRSFHREEPPGISVGVRPAATPVEPPPLMTAGTPPPPGAEYSSSQMVSLPRVGFWKRFLATFLDFIPLCLLIPPTKGWFLAIWTIYHIAMWTWKGTTIGGIIVGIKIVRIDGRPVNFAVALVRSLSSFFSAMALFIGFFWAGWDPEKQSWHDKIAGTAVVKVPKGMSLL